MITRTWRFRQSSEEFDALDKTAVGLGFVGLNALRDALKSWPGAIVVVSHNRDFIESIGVRHEIKLGASGSHKSLRN